MGIEPKIIHTRGSYEPIGPFSQAVVVGNLVFTAGLGGLNPETGKVDSEEVEAQTAQCMENLKNVLEAAGTGLQGVVKAVVYLKDMNDFSTMNQVYARYMGDHRPARSCVAVKELPAREVVKVEAVAVLNDD